MTKDEVVKMFKGPGCYNVHYGNDEVQFNPITVEDLIDMIELWNNDEWGYGTYTFDDIESIETVYTVDGFGDCYIAVRYGNECYLIMNSVWNNDCVTIAMSNYEIDYRGYEEGPYK